MRVLFVMAGLPGDAYHGGAVTCWGLITGFKELGHSIELLSIYDTSISNPYLDYRRDQEKELNLIGVNLIYLEYDQVKLFSQRIEYDIFHKLFTLVKKVDITEVSRILPYTLLSKQIQNVLENTSYDLIFSYHFEPLAALFPVRKKLGPVIVGLGDLLHEPLYYRHRYIYSYSGLIDFFRKKISFLYLRHQQIRVTRELVRWPRIVGFFASHYANFSKIKFNKNISYFRTPIPMPFIKRTRNNSKFSILHIGELNTTATTLGLKEFIEKGYDLLFNGEIKKDDIELYFAGGGEITDKLKTFFLNSNVTYLGRVYPHHTLFLNSDILLVPINVPLGVRIRILTALSFGMVVVAHVANKSGIEELESGYNCVLFSSSEEMALEIQKLFYNKDYRQKLKMGAIETYEKFFKPTITVSEILNLLNN